jgi:hypothetical protein
MYAIPESGIRTRTGMSSLLFKIMAGVAATMAVNRIPPRFLDGRSSEKLVSNTFRIRANAIIFASGMPTSVIRTAVLHEPS